MIEQGVLSTTRDRVGSKWQGISDVYQRVSSNMQNTIVKVVAVFKYIYQKIIDFIAWTCESLGLKRSESERVYIELNDSDDDGEVTIISLGCSVAAQESLPPIRQDANSPRIGDKESVYSEDDFSEGESDQSSILSIESDRDDSFKDEFLEKLQEWRDDPSIPGDKVKAYDKIESAYINGDNELRLNGLGLDSLPSVIGQLQALKHLALANNQLEALPLEIVQLQNLQTISLVGNNISKFPAELHQLEKLDLIYLNENPLIPSIEDDQNRMSYLRFGNFGQFEKGKGMFTKS